MCEKYNIDAKTRFIVLYFDAQMTIREIGRIINKSRWTVGRWEAKIKNGLDIRMKPTSGKPKPTDEENVIYDNPETPRRSRRHASKREARYDELKVSRIAEYVEEDEMTRVDFCKRMLSDEGLLIYRTFFSDEMGIELHSACKAEDGQVSVEKFLNTTQTENFKLNCWGAISARGATTLEIYEKGMKGELYRQMIRKHKIEMEKLYPKGEFYFLQDNHPIHRMNEEWIITEQKLDLIKLPKHSSDLNLMEGIWIVLKDRVASELPINEEELRASLLRHWEILTKPDRLQTFFNALHWRYIECLAEER